MHAILRILILGLATGFISNACAAGDDLDNTVTDRVLPRFDREAREFVKQIGARFISSRWDSATRTLIAVAEMPTPEPRHLNVAYPSSRGANHAQLEAQHIERLCAHPAVGLITQFLKQHDITLAFVYTRPHTDLEPLVVRIDHADLDACT